MRFWKMRRWLHGPMTARCWMDGHDRCLGTFKFGSPCTCPCHRRLHDCEDGA